MARTALIDRRDNNIIWCVYIYNFPENQTRAPTVGIVEYKRRIIEFSHLGKIKYRRHAGAEKVKFERYLLDGVSADYVFGEVHAYIYIYYYTYNWDFGQWKIEDAFGVRSDGNINFMIWPFEFIWYSNSNWLAQCMINILRFSCVYEPFVNFNCALNTHYILTKPANISISCF